MASFQKRGKTWQYTISRMVNGESKPIRKGGFKTKREAQVAALEVENQLHKGINPHLKLEPLNEYFEGWYKLFKTKITSNTERHYEYTLSAINDYFGSTPLQHIDKRKYKEFINQFGEGKSKETVDKVNAHIRACVLEAIDEGIIHVDFTRNVDIHYTVQAKKDSEKHLNYKDSVKLLNELFKRLDRGLGYYLLMLGLSSGLRYAELIGLTRDDFDFKNNIINVDKTWGYTKSMHEGFGATKNESSERRVRVSPKVMHEFKKLFIRMPNNDKELVFFSANSKYKVITNTNANKLLRKTLTDLGIEAVSIHGLRHTFASVLLYKRLSLGYVSKTLGHKNTIRTQQDYSHVLLELEQEDSQKAVNVFDDMIV